MRDKESQTNVSPRGIGEVWFRVMRRGVIDFGAAARRGSVIVIGSVAALAGSDFFHFFCHRPTRRRVGRNSTVLILTGAYPDCQSDVLPG